MMKNFSLMCLFLVIGLTVIGIEKAVAGNEGGGYGHHMPPPVKINFDPTLKAYSDASAKANARANASGFGMGIGQGGTGGAGGAAAVSNSVNGGSGGQGVGSVNVQGVGNSSYSMPRQVPIAFSPTMVPSYSQANCANSVSLGASAAFGAIGGAVPVESDSCNRRLDAQYYQTAGWPRVACERMRQDDDNDEAMKAAGMECKEVEKIAVALPVAAPPQIQTPYLDNYVPRDELNKKLDAIHKTDMLK